MVDSSVLDSDKNYKIPGGWTILALGKLGSFRKGKGVSKAVAQSGEIPCVRYGELYTTHHNVVRQYKSFISSEVAKDSVRLNYGDQLFAGSGEKKEEIGKSAAYIDTFEAYAGGDIVIFSSEKIDPIFLGYALNSKMVREQKEKAAQGDAVVHIYSSSINKIKLLYPIHKKEQLAIAEALSDADALIASLEKLIEKKQKILVSVERSLLSHRSDASYRKIKEIASIVTGSKNTEDQKQVGTYPFFIRSSSIQKIDSFSYNKEAVLTAGDGQVGEIFHYINGKFDAHQRVYIISDFMRDVYGKYFYYQFKNNFYERVMSMTAKSTVDSVRMEMISDMKISIPSLEKQTSISAHLDDYYNEIHLINEKLTKAKKVKEGMMQELLSGRTRLI